MSNFVFLQSVCVCEWVGGVVVTVSPCLTFNSVSKFGKVVFLLHLKGSDIE